MTSEVVLLNKEAVVIAADSAVTVGEKPHPRYSKNANKIFDISVHGNVAATIFSSAEIDRVPWELALKLFRKHDATNAMRGSLSDYVPAVMAQFQANRTLFPAVLLEETLQLKFLVSLLRVLKRAESRYPALVNPATTAEERSGTWDTHLNELAANLQSTDLLPSLGQTNFTTTIAKVDTLVPSAVLELSGRPYADSFDGARLRKLSSIAVEELFKVPNEILNYTGVIFAGYGADEIFPRFHSINVYGFVGGEIAYVDAQKYHIEHDRSAWIQPFAQSSMIERFTDGFDFDQLKRIHEGTLECLNDLVTKLGAAGIAVPQGVGDTLTKQIRDAYVKKWRDENWSANFHPLRRVLSSLSVQEMADLAETLLVLESLRERVTSPSESVGGPIDVAALTKSEGLVWIKRKHYFDPQLNKRYLARMAFAS